MGRYEACFCVTTQVQLFYFFLFCTLHAKRFTLIYMLFALIFSHVPPFAKLVKKMARGILQIIKIF